MLSALPQDPSKERLLSSVDSPTHVPSESVPQTGFPVTPVVSHHVASSVTYPSPDTTTGMKKSLGQQISSHAKWWVNKFRPDQDNLKSDDNELKPLTKSSSCSHDDTCQDTACHVDEAVDLNALLEQQRQAIESRFEPICIHEQEMDLFEAAQRGFLPRLQQILNQQEHVSVQDRDNENCTALHWASINGHMHVAKYLVDKGAQVDALGGDLMATPLHWAARLGHIQLVSFLVKKGANPHLTDNQGYNALHLAAQAGHTMMMVYLNAIGMDLNLVDGKKRTSLMWVAYQGTSLDSMNYLLKQKVDVNWVDETGFTALHWAVITSHFDHAKLLVEAGADETIKDAQGKTPLDWATQRQTSAQYEALLLSSGKMTTSSHPELSVLAIKPPFDEKTTNQIAFMIPFVVLPSSLYYLTLLPWYVGLPTLAVFLGLFYTFGVKYYLLGAGSRHYLSTPMVLGVPWATILFITCQWFYMVPSTGSLYMYHLCFVGLFLLTVTCLYQASAGDPGYLRTTAPEQDKKKQVLELAEQGKLDKRHYCLSCSVVRPLRSKHCRVCDRCVAKFDHHCPWTFNCIGALNHRSFMGFLFGINMGGLVFLRVAWSYLNAYAEETSCTVLNGLCGWLNYSTWTVGLMVWTAINLCWITFLLVLQLAQIATAKTSNEAVNYYRFDYMIHPEDQHILPAKRRHINPFDLGVQGNCFDFWTNKGGLRDINWFDIQQVPIHLQMRAIQEMDKEDHFV